MTGTKCRSGNAIIGSKSISGRGLLGFICSISGSWSWSGSGVRSWAKSGLNLGISHELL